MKELTQQDFIRAANRLKTDVATIKAVAQVESLGKGFYADGFPVILFERHVFRKYTQGRYNKSHPHLSGAAGNYGAAGANQRRKFSEAFALNPQAAMKACSWGKFQIMGFNHRLVGFDTVDAFVDAMKESEGKQLDAFVNFVINSNLADELRAKNWAAFAKGYNGKGYAKNKYDVKLAAAYRKFAAERQLSENKNQKTNRKIERESETVEAEETPQETNSCAPRSNDLEKGEQATETTRLQSETENATVTETKNEQSVTEIEKITEPEKSGFFAKLTAGVTGLLGLTFVQDAAGRLTGVELSMTTIYLICFVLFLGFIGFVVWYVVDSWKQAKRVELEATINTDTKRKNIEFVQKSAE